MSVPTASDNRWRPSPSTSAPNSSSQRTWKRLSSNFTNMAAANKAASMPRQQQQQQGGQHPSQQHQRQPSAPPAPRHPLPQMQGAFEESMKETMEEQEDAARNPYLKADKVQRRKLLLESARYERTVGGKWMQRRGENFHPLWKLVAQISFGMHLLQTGLARSDEEVIRILQQHVDEVDGFLERTTEDFELAQHDITERIRYLRLPLEHGDVFDAMLVDRSFRSAIVDGNEKIEHIVNRTTVAMKDALKDVQKGLDGTQELYRFLAELDARWPRRSDEHEAVYTAMMGNTEGWDGAYRAIQQKGRELGICLDQLGAVISEIQRRAGIASRRNLPSKNHKHSNSSQGGGGSGAGPSGSASGGGGSSNGHSNHQSNSHSKSSSSHSASRRQSSQPSRHTQQPPPSLPQTQHTQQAQQSQPSQPTQHPHASIYGRPGKRQSTDIAPAPSPPQQHQSEQQQQEVQERSQSTAQQSRQSQYNRLSQQQQLQQHQQQQQQQQQPPPSQHQLQSPISPPQSSHIPIANLISNDAQPVQAAVHHELPSITAAETRIRTNPSSIERPISESLQEATRTIIPVELPADPAPSRPRASLHALMTAEALSTSSTRTPISRRSLYQTIEDKAELDAAPEAENKEVGGSDGKGWEDGSGDVERKDKEPATGPYDTREKPETIEEVDEERPSSTGTRRHLYRSLDPFLDPAETGDFTEGENLGPIAKLHDEILTSLGETATGDGEGPRPDPAEPASAAQDTAAEEPMAATHKDSDNTSQRSAPHDVAKSPQMEGQTFFGYASSDADTGSIDARSTPGKGRSRSTTSSQVQPYQPHQARQTTFAESLTPDGEPGNPMEEEGGMVNHRHPIFQDIRSRDALKLETHAATSPLQQRQPQQQAQSPAGLNLSARASNESLSAEARKNSFRASDSSVKPTPNRSGAGSPTDTSNINRVSSSTMGTPMSLLGTAAASDASGAKRRSQTGGQAPVIPPTPINIRRTELVLDDKPPSPSLAELTSATVSGPDMGDPFAPPFTPATPSTATQARHKHQELFERLNGALAEKASKEAGVGAVAELGSNPARHERSTSRDQHKRSPETGNTPPSQPVELQSAGLPAQQAQQAQQPAQPQVQYTQTTVPLTTTTTMTTLDVNDPTQNQMTTSTTGGETYVQTTTVSNMDGNQTFVSTTAGDLPTAQTPSPPPQPPAVQEQALSAAPAAGVAATAPVTPAIILTGGGSMHGRTRTLSPFKMARMVGRGRERSKTPDGLGSGAATASGSKERAGGNGFLSVDSSAAGSSPGKGKSLKRLFSRKAGKKEMAAGNF